MPLYKKSDETEASYRKRMHRESSKALKDCMGYFGGELPDDATQADRRRWRKWEKLAVSYSDSNKRASSPKQGPYTVRLQHSGGTWKLQHIDGEPLYSLEGAKKVARGLARKGYFPGVFKGSKKVWEPK